MSDDPRCNDACDGCNGAYQEAVADVRRLRAELERVRAELEAIAGQPHGTAASYWRQQFQRVTSERDAALARAAGVDRGGHEIRCSTPQRTQRLKERTEIMPHYADGTEAKVGDQVIAPVFNSGGPKAGVIISITPGVESCNALIQFAEVRKKAEPHEPPRMAVRFAVVPAADGVSGVFLSRTVKGEAHGSAGDEFDVYVCADYCDTNKLTKVQ